jgi:hypothetical protein
VQEVPYRAYETNNPQSHTRHTGHKAGGKTIRVNMIHGRPSLNFIMLPFVYLRSGNGLGVLCLFLLVERLLFLDESETQLICKRKYSLTVGFLA